MPWIEDASFEPTVFYALPVSRLLILCVFPRRRPKFWRECVGVAIGFEKFASETQEMELIRSYYVYLLAGFE